MTQTLDPIKPFIHPAYKKDVVSLDSEEYSQEINEIDITQEISYTQDTFEEKTDVELGSNGLPINTLFKYVFAGVVCSYLVLKI